MMFSSSILENILYGNLKATNSEIEQAALTANCQDFVETGNLFKWDFTADSLAATMIKNKQIIVQKIGEQKYNNELQMIQQIDDEDEQGLMNRITIDFRDNSLKDKELPKGYNEYVGVDGARLSLDQKQRLSIARAIVYKPRVLLVDDLLETLHPQQARLGLLKVEHHNFTTRLAQRLYHSLGGFPATTEVVGGDV